MADNDRQYSNQTRDWGRERGDHDWEGENRERFSEKRLDDRTGYGPGSSGGYRADRQGENRDYGRDDEAGAAYGRYEDRSFSGERGGYSEYGQGSTGRSRSASAYQTNRPDSGASSYGYGGSDRYRSSGIKPNYDSGGYGGRQRTHRGGENYGFTPYGEGHGGMGPDFGFGHDLDRSQGQDHRYGRDNDRGFLDRAADRVSSWFGDDEARARLRGDHAGRGPKGYKRSDDRIREDVSDRLADDSWLDASDIEVTVSENEVTLTGTVPDRDAKRRAERLAEDISGVNHVQNNLRVSQMNQGMSQGSPTLAEGDQSATIANPTLNKQAAGRTN